MNDYSPMICARCERFGATCAGPNFLAMDLQTWTAWCRARKRALDWTNERVAEMTGVATSTVAGIMSQNLNKTIRADTMATVTRALCGDTWRAFTCDVVAKPPAPTELLLDVVRLVGEVNSISAACKELYGAIVGVTAQVDPQV